MKKRAFRLTRRSVRFISTSQNVVAEGYQKFVLHRVTSVTACTWKSFVHVAFWRHPVQNRVCAPGTPTVVSRVFYSHLKPIVHKQNADIKTNKRVGAAVVKSV